MGALTKQRSAVRKRTGTQVGQEEMMVTPGLWKNRVMSQTGVDWGGFRRDFFQTRSCLKCDMWLVRDLMFLVTLRRDLDDSDS